MFDDAIFDPVIFDTGTPPPAPTSRVQKHYVIAAKKAGRLMGG